MNGESVDIVAHVEDRLDDAKAAAAAAYDRLDACRELRALLFDFAGRRGTPQITLAELFELPESAEEDARLRSLVDRALPETNEEEEYP